MHYEGYIYEFKQRIGTSDELNYDAIASAVFAVMEEGRTIEGRVKRHH
ncbi:MAG: hypothetical protein HC893_09450 [Chloroflexaceae bacterium]|nr:hypothetical protein [Chloroflexaceae bacterium]